MKSLNVQSESPYYFGTYSTEIQFFTSSKVSIIDGGGL